MKITARRAVQGVRAAMETAGLGRTSTLNGGEIAGWIERNRFGSTGFSLRPDDEGRVHWHVVVSGRPHLRYVSERRPRPDGDVDTLEVPRNPERLHGRIRAVFEGLGIDVREVRAGGWQEMWDDDVDYDVVTDWPEWLEAYDPSNTPSPSGAEATLVSASLRHRRTDPSPPVVRKPLPAYVVGMQVMLTRESVAEIVRVSEEHNADVAQRRRNGRVDAMSCSHAELMEDGRFRYRTISGRESLVEPVTVTNHWGDEVQAWPTPQGMMVPGEPFEPSVPVMVDGEFRTGVPFAVYDEQFGEAPWSERTSSPAP